MYEQEVAKLQGARITLENQALSLESATVNIEVFKTVEQGTKAMKGLRGNIDADRVDDLMDDMAEEKDTADQISEAISRPAQDMFDDDELLNELAELEELELDEKLLTPPIPTNPNTISNNNNNVISNNNNNNVISNDNNNVIPNTVFEMPQVPTNNIQNNVINTNETEEDIALRELQNSMLA
eukprot:TRINITY_DN60853_c0_g1_i1.p1 TRINITY_DN60853_c0_g1~~TRINITY_DN60853_c0_g1_i1.p1  ORF type:complete len:183 (+),score=26.71 TRINITY_DN60853_c0_g1_i1:316-864(+)